MYLRILILVLLALAAGGAQGPALAQGPEGETASAEVLPGCAGAGGEPGDGPGLAAATRLGSTYIVQSFPPLSSVAPISTTHTLSGSFPSSPWFSYCRTGRQVSFSSTGGSCTHDPSQRRFNCPSGITSFTYRYICTNNGERFGRFHTLSPSFTTSYDVDATLIFRYPSYMRLVTATPAPQASAAGYLRWEQPDTSLASFKVVLEDTRVHVVFLPLLRR